MFGIVFISARFFGLVPIIFKEKFDQHWLKPKTLLVSPWVWRLNQSTYRVPICMCRVFGVDTIFTWKTSLLWSCAISWQETVSQAYITFILRTFPLFAPFVFAAKVLVKCERVYHMIHSHYWIAMRVNRRHARSRAICGIVGLIWLPGGSRTGWTKGLCCGLAWHWARFVAGNWIQVRKNLPHTGANSMTLKVVAYMENKSLSDFIAISLNYSAATKVEDIHPMRLEGNKI